MSTRQASRPPQRRKTPVWVVIVGVVIGAVVLFAAGFGISRLIRGGTSTASSDVATSAAPEESCVMVTVTPAETLPQPAQITLNVYNSTNRVGLAAKTADELRARGFLVEKIDNDPKGSGMTSVGEVRYGKKGEAQAQVVAFYIPGITLVNDGRKGKTVDVAIGQQFTALASKSDVDTAMAEPSESPSGAGCPSDMPTKAPGGGATDQPASGSPSGEATPATTGEASPAAS